MENWAYAGWNTNGNTLGTVISNSIILFLFEGHKANTIFNELRIIEDLGYQAILRQELEQYVEETSDSTENLAVDLNFYERYVWKVLANGMDELSEIYSLPWQLKEVYFPWNRTFEIGLIAQ